MKIYTGWINILLCGFNMLKVFQKLYLKKDDKS